MLPKRFLREEIFLSKFARGSMTQGEVDFIHKIRTPRFEETVSQVGKFPHYRLQLQEKGKWKCVRIIGVKENRRFRCKHREKVSSRSGLIRKDSRKVLLPYPANGMGCIILISSKP